MTTDSVRPKLDRRAVLAEIAAYPEDVPMPTSVQLLDPEDGCRAQVTLHYRSVADVELWAVHVGADLDDPIYRTGYTYVQRSAWLYDGSYMLSAIGSTRLSDDEAARLLFQHAGLDVE